jgi:hypothetical protein
VFFNRDACSTHGSAEDVYKNRHHLAGTLVEFVDRVTMLSKRKPGLVSVRPVCPPIPNVVKSILVLLNGNRCVVGQILLGPNHLAQVVLLVKPAGRIGLGQLDPLIGGVVLVIEPNYRGRSGRRGNRCHVVQGIGLSGRGYPVHAVVGQQNLAHQYRIWQKNFARHFRFKNG